MKAVKALVRTILAGIVAVAILSGIMCLYDLRPVHHENPKGNTDYVWESNAPWVRLTEGISWGRFDTDGFNNPAVIEDPDILILGSSHMEATNVCFDQSVCGQLAKKLEDRYSVYNLGMSGHHLFKVCQYLPINLKMHETAPKVAVIETSSVSVSAENVRKMLNFEVDHTPSHATGLIGLLQKVPFIRTIYTQMDNGLLNLFMDRRGDAAKTADEEIVEEIPVDAIDENAYDQFFGYLASMEKEYGTQIIIFYHPTETLDDEAGIVFNTTAALDAFDAYARKYGIDFINMAASFKEMYLADHLVAHGFVTGRVASGHLNANGHRAVAEALYKVINNLEEEGVLCK